MHTWIQLGLLLVLINVYLKLKLSEKNRQNYTWVKRTECNMCMHVLAHMQLKITGSLHGAAQRQTE